MVTECILRSTQITEMSGLQEVRFRREKGRTRDGRLLEDHVLRASGPGDCGSVTLASRSCRGFYISPVASLVALLEGLEEFWRLGTKA